jgi:transposase
VTDAAANFGFSRPSFYQALSAFEQDGLAGLVPHKRGPKQAHKLTEEVLSFIGEARQKAPSVRLPDLVKLIQERFGTKVHPRSIERSLLRHQKKPRCAKPPTRRPLVRIWFLGTNNCAAMSSARRLTAAKAWASRYFSGVE